MRLWNSCHGGDAINMYCMFSGQGSIGSAAGSHVLRSARPRCSRAAAPTPGTRAAAWHSGPRSWHRPRACPSGAAASLAEPSARLLAVRREEPCACGASPPNPRAAAGTRLSQPGQSCTQQRRTEPCAALLFAGCCVGLPGSFKPPFSRLFSVLAAYRLLLIL